jgi:hypothetical protein
MSELTGRIKSILKNPTAPRLSYRHRVLDRITHAHRYLVSHKETTRTDFNPVKLNIKCSPESLPYWLDPLSAVLQLYLDVKIIKTKELNGLNVINTYSVIGNKEDALIASKYIDYIYTSVYLLAELKRERASNSNRKLRRKAKRINKIIFTTDARIISSDFKDNILKSILNLLNELLESIKYDEHVAYLNSRAKQARLTTYLENKYSRTWKTILSNNG